MPEGPPVGKFIRQSLKTFHCLSYFGLQNRKRCGPELLHGLFWKKVGSDLLKSDNVKSRLHWLRTKSGVIYQNIRGTKAEESLSCPNPAFSCPVLPCPALPCLCLVLSCQKLAEYAKDQLGSACPLCF